MRFPSAREVGTEARLLLIGIPVLIWTLLPIYHLFLFAISPKESAFSGKLWPDHPTLHNFGVVFRQEHYYLHHFWQQFWNSLVIAVAIAGGTAVGSVIAARRWPRSNRARSGSARNESRRIPSCGRQGSRLRACRAISDRILIVPAA